MSSDAESAPAPVIVFAVLDAVTPWMRALSRLPDVAMPGPGCVGRGRSGGRGRGRGGGRGGRGRPRKLDSPTVRLSKNLSQLLRHGAHDAGLGDCLAEDGFVPLARVLALPRFHRVTAEDVRALVAACEKGRFELREAGVDGALESLIRATQGHTIASGLDDDAMLTRLDETSDVVEAVHGTSRGAWERIRVDGLSRMRRRHVHLAKGLPGDGQVVSGMRADSRVAVWVDVARGIREGLPFYVSANGVVLTPGEGETGTVPARLFLRAHALPGGEPLELAAPAE